MTQANPEHGRFWNTLARRAVVPGDSRLNPVWRVAETTSRAWVRRYALIDDGHAESRLRSSQMSRLVGRFYPDADTKGLCLAADALAWAFILDDIGDESPLGRDPDGLRSRLLRIAEGLGDGDPEDPLGVALQELDRRVSELARPEHRRTFRRGVQEFFAGLCWEASNRSAGVTPSLHDFIEMRPAAGAANMFIALLEITGEHDVPDTWRDGPVGRRSLRAACNAMCWINDLLSVDKELRHGDVHNLVLVTAHERDLPLAEATEAALDAYNAEVHAFSELAASISPRHPARRFMDGLANMIAGTRSWTLESARYRATPETTPAS